ncbi:MAG: D-Ala-D-Ala carboxypeptidase family metallohydrolase [Nannocystaceae bacterium]
MQITATTTTFLKKSPHQASSLGDDQKVAVAPGRSYGISSYDEIEHDEAPDGADGHSRVELAAGAGTWFIFNGHWELPWSEVATGTGGSSAPDWNEVNWSNYSSPVSKYFTVGEVTLRAAERIPTEATIKQNIIRVARLMDEIREWWGGPVGVTSWYRPWHVNRRIGSRAPNHPAGHAVDFYPMRGSVYDMQARFNVDWYQTGRWPGGFGLGAPKGFIHVDLRHRRVWTY